MGPCFQVHGLHKPSLDGRIFVYRTPPTLGVKPLSRICVLTIPGTGPEPILAEIAARFENLANPGLVEPWRLLTVDTTRGRSRNRELHHPCYILVDFGAFRSFGLRPHGLVELVLGPNEFSFPTILPLAVNVPILGDFLAPLLPTGLPGLQWQAWLNGEPVALQLLTCPEGFFLQVHVQCGLVLLQNLQVSAPLMADFLHVDMEVIEDSKVRVTVYIPGGDTLMSSRVLTISCDRAGMESLILRELHRHFYDLQLVRFQLVPVHLAVTWVAPIITTGQEKLVLVYEEAALQAAAVVLLKLHLPPYFAEGAIYCPKRLKKQDLFGLLGLQFLLEDGGEHHICYVNSEPLSNDHECEIEDGDFVWCLHAAPDPVDVDVLSVASQSCPSVEEIS